MKNLQHHGGLILGLACAVWVGFLGWTSGAGSAVPALGEPAAAVALYERQLQKKLDDYTGQDKAPEIAQGQAEREEDRNDQLALIIFSEGVSGCLGSACALSGCGVSGCGLSGCGGSGCSGSVCGGSACAGSACGGSECGGSACGGSACNGSLCAGTGCYGSLCASATQCDSAECMQSSGKKLSAQLAELALSPGRIVGFDARPAVGGIETSFIATGAAWESYALYRMEADGRVLVARGPALADTLLRVTDAAGDAGSAYSLQVRDGASRVAGLTYSPDGAGSGVFGGDAICPL